MIEYNLNVAITNCAPPPFNIKTRLLNYSSLWLLNLIYFIKCFENPSKQVVISINKLLEIDLYFKYIKNLKTVSLNGF